MAACNGNKPSSDDFVDISLSTSQVSVQVGATASVNVTRGNGDYAVTSSAPSVATASVSNAAVTITGVSAGSAVVTVTDKGSKEAKINVTVEEAPAVQTDLALEAASGAVTEGAESFISIISGNGGYSAESSDEGVVTASINGDFLIITGKGSGTATVTVTDSAGKTATYEVKVTPVPKGVDMGTGYGWGKQGTHTIVRIPFITTYSASRDFTKMEALTIECLVRFNAFLEWADNDTSNWLNTIMGNPDYFMLRLNHFSNGQPRVNALVAGREMNSPAISAEQWYHVALTFDKGYVALYLDGELVEDGTLEGVSTLDMTHCEIPVDQWYDFFLGCYRCSRWLNGCMSEVRYWGVARTQEQIRANRTYIDPDDKSATEGLIGYWKLAGSEAEEILKDYSGNGYDGEILGAEFFTKVNVDVDYAL